MDVHMKILLITYEYLGTRWHGLLQHCATNRKVAGSIPDVIRIIH